MTRRLHHALLCAFAIVCLAVAAAAQNYSAVAATNIVDLNGAKLAAGKLCFEAHDAQRRPLNFKVGGGGQVIKGPRCTAVTNGAIGAWQVANPAITSPAGIRYHVTAENKLGVVVLDYYDVTWETPAFDLDSYVPNTATIPSGQSVAKLTVADLIVTNSCTGAGCGTGGGGGGGPVSWGTITGTLTNQLDLNTALTGKAALSHTHTTGQISNFPATWAWASITGKPTTFAPSAHTHLTGEITNFPTTWAWASITGAPEFASTKVCTGNDKFSGYNATTGTFTCTADQTGAGGSGITSLNGATQTTQTFANGANISITTNTSTGVHTVAATGLASATHDHNSAYATKASEHAHANKALLDTYDQTNASITDAVTKKHAHANATTLDKITESGGLPLWNGSAWPGGGGGGGTSDHALLSHLAFSDSGHTGFAPEVHTHGNGTTDANGNLSIPGYMQTGTASTNPTSMLNIRSTTIAGLASLSRPEFPLTTNESLVMVHDAIGCGDTTAGGGSVLQLLQCTNTATGSCSSWRVVACSAQSFTPGGDLSGTGASQQVEGLKGAALPPLADGWLHWNGTTFGWELNMPGPASSGLAVWDNINKRWNDSLLVPDGQIATVGGENTFTAKQSFSAGSGRASERSVPISGTPSGLVEGDRWFNGVDHRLHIYDGTADRTVAYTSDIVAPASARSRTCAITFGDDAAAAALTNTNLAPQKSLCYINQNATITSIIVTADAGTASVTLSKRNAALTTIGGASTTGTLPSGEKMGCAAVTVTIQGSSSYTCGALDNTTLSQGDTIESSASSTNGVAKRVSVFLNYTVNP